MKVNLPIQFQNRMQDILGAELGDFLACYQDPPQNGLRVNTLKIGPEDFLKTTPFPLQPVPWCPEGFSLQAKPEIQQNPGKHIFHAAGLYYLQDPSAMAAARILSPQPGALALDLTAAPGGKTTHLAAIMRNEGC
jgi:16S rRNA C967 or C1407 C5-methylase (RsmB/RsmF family)